MGQSIAASLHERQFTATQSPVTPAAPANASSSVALRARPFYTANPNYNPADPTSPLMIEDPTATAAPQAVQWTSPDGLTTIGVMNPFGLTKNDPSIGFYGAPPASTLQRS